MSESRRFSRAPVDSGVAVDAVGGCATLAMPGGGEGGRRRTLCGHGQDFIAGLRYEHGVLPLRRQAVVLRHYRPAVRQLADAGAAGVDHWFDGERHARDQLQSGARTAVVQDLRLFMEFAADPVTAKFAHDAAAITLGAALDRVANVAQAGAGAHFGDAAPHTFVRDFAEAARLDRRIADKIHGAGIAAGARLD